MTDSSRAGHYPDEPAMDAAPIAQRSSGEVVTPRTGGLTIEALYEAHFDFVWRSLRHLGVADAAIDDATQDTFVVAHRRLRDFAERSSPRTWLFGIALRVARDYRRSRARRERFLTAFGHKPEVAVTTPYEHTVRAEATRTLHTFLETLPEDQRAVFVMADLEQMTAPEIAEALSANINTVYSRLRVARVAFNAALARMHDGAKGPGRG